MLNDGAVDSVFVCWAPTGRRCRLGDQSLENVVLRELVCCSFDHGLRGKQTMIVVFQVSVLSCS